MESKARSFGISLLLDLDAGLRPVRGVDVHIEQVLLNLIRNAIEGIHGAGMTGGTITVTSGMHTGDEMAQVCVRERVSQRLRSVVQCGVRLLKRDVV